MHNRNFGDIPVAVTENSPQPAPKWPVGGDQPQVRVAEERFNATGKHLSVAPNSVEIYEFTRA